MPGNIGFPFYLYFYMVGGFVHSIKLMNKYNLGSTSDSCSTTPVTFSINVFMDCSEEAFSMFGLLHLYVYTGFSLYYSILDDG